MADPINDILSGLSSLFSGSSAPSGASQPADPTENMFRPTFAQRLNAVGQAFQGQSPGNLDQDATARNATYTALLSKGIDADTAKLAVSNPHVLQAMLPQLFGAKQAPQIVEFDGPYGQKQKKFWNPKANKYEDASTLFDAPAPVAPVAPAQAGPQMVAPVAPVTTAALGPVSMPGMQPSDDIPTVPSFAPRSPWAPAAQPQQAPQQLGIQPAATSPDYVFGHAVPKPPEGYVHKAAQDGSSYLWSRSTGQPIFESKAEAEARGKRQDEGAATKVSEAKTATQFTGGLEQLTRFPGEFGKEAFERALGPLSANDPNPESATGIFGSGISVPSALRMGAHAIGELKTAAFGGAAPTEVRDRIETATKNLAAVMKPMIRKPGEGAWSDKDQANLEAQLGTLTRSRSVEEYSRRLADIQDNIRQIFLINAQSPRAPTRSPNAPLTAEKEVTSFEWVPW